MSHDHAPRNFGRAFAIGISLNVVYVLVEAGIGIRVGSVGLVADAGHNASDVLSLILAWAGAAMARRAASDQFTYGLRRTPVLTSLFNALLLFGAMGAIAWEAIGRLGTTTPVPGETMIWVAAVGLIVNFGTAMLFVRNEGDVNIRGAYLHMLADGLVTLGVLVAGVAIAYTGLSWIDPIISLVIVLVVTWSTWGLFRESLNLSLDAAPSRIDVPAVRTWLLSLPGVQGVHDLHIWAMSTTEVALTVHLVVDSDEAMTSSLVLQAQEGLIAHFDVHHATIQVEGPEVANTQPATICS